MHRFALVLFPCLLGLFGQRAKADEPLGNDAVSVYCGQNSNGEFACVAKRAFDAKQAQSAARLACTLDFHNCQESLSPTRNMCVSGFANDALHQVFVVGSSSDSLATSSAQSQCSFANVSLAQRCHELFTLCPQNLEIADAPPPTPPVITLPVPIIQTPSPAVTRPEFSLIDLSAISTGLSFGVGIIIALLIYAKRTAIANVIIHGNLPQKIPVYADDVQVLFKRTQRVNWYGHVVFGVIARLSMDHKQFSLVRRYWLGRVIAFDSLRRQRQNQLARMHLQLAASLKPEPTDKKKALSQLWTVIKYFFFLSFYLVRALFSFLFGFLFIRVTIAKLIRGKLIESKDLVLVLQAKEAVEQSAQYLKEYLTSAETFDGREELFESK